MGRSRGRFSQALLPNRDKNTKFKDNRERFRLFNRLYKEPKKVSMHLTTVVCLVLTLIPLVYPESVFTTMNLILLILGIVVTVGLEQGANLHYMRFSRVANERSYSSVKFNIRLNLIMRSLAMIGWILTALALVSMMIWNGTLDIWNTKLKPSN